MILEFLESWPTYVWDFSVALRLELGLVGMINNIWRKEGQRKEEEGGSMSKGSVLTVLKYVQAAL